MDSALSYAVIRLPETTEADFKRLAEAKKVPCRATLPVLNDQLACKS